MPLKRASKKGSKKKLITKGSKKRSITKRSKKPSTSRARSLAQANRRAMERTTKNPCGPGKILRKSFTRHLSRGSRKRTRVSARCITDLGNPGYGAKVIPPLKNGLLRSFGYQANASTGIRHDAINKAVNTLGPQEVSKHLRAVVTLQRWNPATHDAMLNDFNYLRKKFFPDRVEKYQTVGY